MPITNFKLRITNAGTRFRNSLFFCFLLLLPAYSFAQNLETLAQVIERGSVEQKRDALSQIRNLQSAEASRIAVPALKDASEIVRATAVFSVIYLPKDEAAEILILLLGDRKPLVRREAAYALGKVGSGRAVDALLFFFRYEKNLEVKNAQIIALGEIGNQFAISELTKILQRKPNAKEEFLRRSAARSVGQIAQAIQADRVNVSVPENFSSDEQRAKASRENQVIDEILRDFRPAMQILIRILKNKNEADDVRREAAFALGAIGDESAISVLKSNLNVEDYYLSEICRESLLKIKLPPPQN